MKWLIVIAVLGCGPSKPPAGQGSAGSSGATAGTTAGTTSGTTTGTACDGARAKVDRLYRADAQAREPKRVDEAVADNTAMVMNDCVKAPDKVTACIASVTSVIDLEARCLVALDDEGSEGDALAR
jgi:hypothetical protein